MKIRKLSANSETEAVGYEFTPSSADSKLNYALEARGAANGDKVGIFLKMWLKGQFNESMQSALQNGGTTIDASGYFNNIGDLSNKSLSSKLAMTIAAVQPDMSVNFSVNQDVQAQGLGLGQLAEIKETSTFSGQVRSNSESNSTSANGALVFSIKELTPSVIEVNTSVIQDGRTNQSYHIVLVKDSSGACRVSQVSR